MNALDRKISPDSDWVVVFPGEDSPVSSPKNSPKEEVKKVDEVVKKVVVTPVPAPEYTCAAHVGVSFQKTAASNAEEVTFCQKIKNCFQTTFC